MHWLLVNLQPLDADGGLGVCQRLPCPAHELLQLATAADSSDSNASRLFEQVHWSLRTNPALLIFALSKYFSYVGTAAEDADELVQWITPRLLIDLKKQPLAPLTSKQRRRFEVGVGSTSSEVWNSFLHARRNKKLRRTLGQWLKHFTSTDKATRKRWLDAILDKRFRADQFACSGVRKASTQNLIEQQWAADRGVAQLPSVLELAIAHQSLRNDFDSKLETEKLASMKQLAYGASHEINNPLANVATRAQTMLSDEQHPEKRRKLAVMYQQAMRAHEMISDMMLFAHPPALRVQSISLRILMRRLIGQWESILQRATPGGSNAADVNLKITVSGEIDQVELDPGQCLVALSALIKNSVEAIRSKPTSQGEIDVRVSCDANALGEGELAIKITDDGIGIESDVARHLFDPFFSGREAGRGLGFGLSKAWRIAERHGGWLRYDNGFSKGTRFEFRVPTVPGNRVRGLEATKFELGASAIVAKAQLKKTA